MILQNGAIAQSQFAERDQERRAAHLRDLPTDGLTRQRQMQQMATVTATGYAHIIVTHILVHVWGRIQNLIYSIFAFLYHGVLYCHNLTVEH